MRNASPKILSFGQRRIACERFFINAPCVCVGERVLLHVGCRSFNKFAEFACRNKFVDRRLVFQNDFWFFLNDGCVIGNVDCDRTTRSDADVVSDFDVADNCRARSDVAILADGRKAGIFAVGQSIASNRHVLKNCTAFADFCICRNCNAVKSMRRMKLIDIFLRGNARSENPIDVTTFCQGFLLFEFIFRRQCNLSIFPKHFCQARHLRFHRQHFIDGLTSVYHVENGLNISLHRIIPSN